MNTVALKAERVTRRAALLEHIASNGPRTNAELAQELEVTLCRVASLTQLLRRRGVLVLVNGRNAIPESTIDE